MLCAFAGCREHRYVNGISRPFCRDHGVEFEAAPEGRNPRPTGAVDWRDRRAKEERADRERRLVEAALTVRAKAKA